MRLRLAASLLVLTCGCAATDAPLAGSSPAPVQANVDRPIVNGEAARQIDAYLTRFSDYGYGFSLLVAQGDEVLLQKAYGPGLDPNSVFNVASVAKQFTATAIVKLAAEGKLKLSDPITTFFPEAPAYFSAVTVDHLLAHTSGIRDDYSLMPGFRTPQELPRHVLKQPLASKPGAEWEYSNFGYSLLALIVERASGQPFKEYMRSALFQPARLRNTGFAEDDLWTKSTWPEAKGGLQPEDPRIDFWGFGLGGSDIVSSPADIYRWVRALHDGRILPEQWRVLLDEPVIPVFAGLKYGRGWWIREVELAGKKRLNIWHSGQEDEGFSAWLNRYPAEDLVTVFLTNQGYEGQPLREALNAAGGPSTLEKLIYGGDVYWPPRPVDEVNLDTLTGIYRIDEANWLSVRARPPFLEVIPHGQAAFDALLPTRSGDKAREVVAAATTRTKEIFKALQTGDQAPLRRYGGGGPIPPELLSGIENYEVLGSAPIQVIKDNGAGLVATYIVVKRAGEDQYWRIQWSSNDAGAIYRSTQPVLPLFRAIGATGFANFQPLIRGSAFLNFDATGVLAGQARARRE